MADRDPAIHLGEHTERAERLVAGGSFESIDHVVEAALNALERQEEAVTAILRKKVAEALADPRPTLPLDEAMTEIRARIEARRTA